MCLSEKQAHGSVSSNNDYYVTISSGMNPHFCEVVVSAADFNDAVFKAKQEIKKRFFISKVELVNKKGND